MARMRRKFADRKKVTKKPTKTKKKWGSAKEKFIKKTSERKPIDYSGLTGRDAAIVKSHKKSKAGNIKEFEQSIGSLDRRINKAIEGGNIDAAKDLRSRQNKITTKLGLARAIQLQDGVARSKDGKILRSSTTGQPLLTSRGRDIFDKTKDFDFIDPTRRLQNVAPDAYKEMYPISSAIQGGPLGLQMIKNALNRKDKDIPYRYPGSDNIFGEGEFPAQRYANDYDPWWRHKLNPPDAAPTEEVTISDMVIPEARDDQEGAFEYDPVPYIHPAIDPNKRSDVMEEGYGDIIESGRQDYDTLFDEWEKNNLNQDDSLDKFGDPHDPVKLQELMDAVRARDAEQEAFAKERQNKFYNKDGIEVGGEGNLLNVGKELYNLGGYLSGGQALNKYVLEPGANAILGENQMIPIDQSEFNPENIDYSQITETLKGPKYNLQDDQIQELLNYKPDLLNSSDINSTLADFYSQ